MNTCVVCGDPCIRSICPNCLYDLYSVDEKVVVRFLNASAGRDKVIEKKVKPTEFFKDPDDLRVELYGMEHSEHCPPGDPMCPQPEEEN